MQLHTQQHLIDRNQQARFTQQPQYEPEDLQSAAHTTYPVRSHQQDHSMAHMMTPQYQQYQPENDVASHQWSQSNFPQNFAPTPTMSAPLEHATGGSTVPNTIWGAARRSYASNEAAHMPAYNGSGMEADLSSTLGSPFLGAPMQHFYNKSMVQYGMESYGLRLRNVNGQDMESNSSMSPRSCKSDFSAPGDIAFTPASDSPASQQAQWRRNLSSQPTFKVSTSPVLGPDTFSELSNESWPEQQPQSVSFASEPHTPVENSLVVHEMRTPEDSSEDGEQHQERSTGDANSWGNHGSAHHQVVVHRPRNFPIPQTNRPTYNASLSQYQYQDYSLTGQSRALTLHNGTQVSIPTQMVAAPQYHGHFQGQVMDAAVQRKEDDETLLDGKRANLTYKEIREKLHVKCAESTLRGRFRSLMKPRQERVRKPVWTEKDIGLLKKYVRDSLAVIDHTQPSLGYEQRLAKVQWKKIADNIRNHGGSYHFGNATCKRKWVEISRGR